MYPNHSTKGRSAAICLLFLALIAPASLLAVTLSFSASAPTPGANDIYNFTGAGFDADNVGGSGVNAAGGANNGAANDNTTYVAGNRPFQGQSFLTGTNANGYDLTTFTIRVAGYTNNAAGGTNNVNWNLGDLGFLRVRVMEIRDGTNSVPVSYQYAQTGAPGNPGSGNSANGAGTWLTFVFNYPVHLNSNSTYGVDIAPANGSGAYFEWLGIRDGATGGNPYTNGSAYVDGGWYYKLAPQVSDRVFLASLSASPAPVAYVHPGALHTEADFQRMSNKVAAAAQPWKASYDLLTASPYAGTGWPAHPVEWIVRGGSGQNYTRSQQDAAAIYQLGLRWRLTGDTNYANHAVYIMNAWANTLVGVTGDSNQSLGSGICGAQFACAAEMLSTYSGWSAADRRKFKDMMMRAFYVSNDDFLWRHHDNCSTHYRLNWDTASMVSVLSIGVLCDNPAVFNQALGYFYNGDINGNIQNAIWYIHPDGLGQAEESGRDQGHNNGGLNFLSRFCQVAWNQGVDAFGYDNNRVLRGLEYIAKYNLGGDVGYVPHRTCDMNYTEEVAAYWDRGRFDPMYELLYNHYVNVKGLSAPYCKQAADLLRPEPGPNTSIHPSQVDWFGFGTLTYTREPFVGDLPPGGLTAKVSGQQMLLNWWGSAYATNYVVKRGTVSGGPYTNLATLSVSDSRMYYDTNLTSGATYYYVVSSLTPSGESPNSAEVSATIGAQLIAYLKFNEASGTNATDATSNNITGTLLNGATWTAGKYGNAVNLAGASNQYVRLPENTSRKLTDFTIAAWVNPTTLSSWMRVCDFGDGTPLPYIELTPTRYMYLAARNGSGVPRFGITANYSSMEQGISGTAALPTGSWSHLAVTLSGSTATLYVNGAAVGSNSGIYVTPDQLSDTSQNWLGRSQWNDPYLNGKIDDFRIYNGALPASQIAAMAAAGAPTNAPVAPTSPGASAVSASQINLVWNVAATASSYAVKRSLASGGPYTEIADGITATNFSDTDLEGSTTYYYVIAAANDGGQGANSVEASATTLTPPPTPSLTATGIYGGNIALSWTTSAGATSYNIKRSQISGGSYVTLFSGITSTTFTNSGLTIGSTYYYVVSAVNANGESPNSNEAGSVVPVPTLVWKGNVNTNWDLNTTTNWLFGGSPNTYFADGAAAIFNDTATTGTVNLTANVAPYSLVFSNSTLSYTVTSTNGSGIGGAATLEKWSTGTVTLNNTNTFTGDMNINVGGVTVNGLLGGGNYAGDIANYGTFTYSGAATQTVSGVISLSGSVVKSGTGTLTLSGDNTFTGATTHRQGTLNLSGAAKTGSIGIYVVDNNAASTTSAMLNISSSVTANRLWLGDRAGSGQVGAAYQTGGDVWLTQGASVDDFRIGSVAGGRGYYKLSGGTLTVNEVGVGGSLNDTIGILDITGGTFTDNGWLAVAHGGGTGSGLLNITGGSASAGRVDMNWSGNSSAVSIVNVGGGTNAASLTAAASTTLGVNLSEGSTTAGTLSIVNLRTNGTLTTGKVRASQANPTTLLNFDGGTLKANLSSGNFLTDPSIDGIYVYPNGGTIDNGGKTVAVDRPLLAPTGVGVSSITGPSVQGSGYVGAPLVTITGGTGSGATAYAVMADDGTGKGTFKVSSIVVSSRGVYTVAPTTVTLTGGGATVAASGLSISSAANTSGGMTFKGAGTTFLSGASTYTGPTLIAEGTVKQAGPLLYLSFDNTNGTTVVNGGSGGWALNGTLTGANVSITNGGRYGKGLAVSNGAVNTGYVLVNSPVVNFNNGSTWSWAMWVRTTTAGGAYMYQGDGGWASGNTSFYLNPGSAATGTKGGGVRFAQGWQTGTATLNDGAWHFIAMTCTNGTKVFYVDGAVDAWAANAWSGNGNGGQLWIGGTADTGDGNAPLNGTIDEVFVYGRALSQADVTNLMNGVIAHSPALPPATDLTVASGATLVLVSSNQTIGALSGGNSGTIQLGAGSTPTALTLGKNTSSTFAGSIAGSGSLTKIGPGDLTISGINAYSGTTTISNGAVRFGQSDNTNYVASLGPLLWFNFEQGIGDGIVTNIGLGGAALNGEIIGGATIVGGRYGNGMNLDGTSYISIPDKVAPLGCDTDGAGWTYALWIKTATAGATFGYQGDGNWSSGAMTFYLNNNSVAGSKAGGVRYTDGWLTGTATLNNNAWRFIAITVSGGVKTIYVDGNVDAKTGTTGWNAAASTSANQFWIGDSPDAGDGVVPFNGQLDEVFMFNRALSQVEIQNIMSNKTVVALGMTSGQLPPASPVNLGSAGTLDLSGTLQTIPSLSDIGGSGGVVTNGAGGAASLLINSSTSNTFSGSIRGNIELVKSGSGTQTLNGAHSFSGNTTVNAGALAFGQAALPANGIVSVTNGAVLNLNFSGINPVAGLVLNGAIQQPGHYNAANSAPYLSGTGYLLVQSAVASPNIAERIYALTAGNQLIAFGSTAPGDILTAYTVSGLAVNEKIVGIDFWNGTLYGLGDQSRLYTINRANGAAGLVGAFTPVLNGQAFGVEAEPGGLRVVSDLDQNLLLDYATGTATVGTTISGSPNPALTGLAYQPVNGQWYVADYSQNTVELLNPASGLVSTIGLAGIDFSRHNGFDISGNPGNAAYLASPAASSDPAANLYKVDLTTGAATLVGLVGLNGDNTLIRGLSVGPEFSIPPIVNQNPTNLTFSVSGGNLTLSWPASHLGWTLQCQTNSRSVGLSGVWVPCNGGYASTNNVVIPIGPADGTVFFRLVYP